MAIKEPADFPLPDIEPRTENRREIGVAWLTKSRIENLSDGVFSIAMTLLVLDLKIPRLSDGMDYQGLWAELAHLVPRFESYALGFIILGVYWIGHHMQFHFIRRTDKVFLWMNLLFLAAISFLPFPTSVLGEYPNNEAAVLFFGSSILVTSTIFLVHFLYGTRGRRLIDENMTSSQIKQTGVRIAFLPLTALIGMILAPFSTRASLLFYLSASFLYLIPTALDSIKAPAKRKHKIPSELF